MKIFLMSKVVKTAVGPVTMSLHTVETPCSPPLYEYTAEFPVNGVTLYSHIRVSVYEMMNGPAIQEFITESLLRHLSREAFRVTA